MDSSFIAIAEAYFREHFDGVEIDRAFDCGDFYVFCPCLDNASLCGINPIRIDKKSKAVKVFLLSNKANYSLLETATEVSKS